MARPTPHNIPRKRPIATKGRINAKALLAKTRRFRAGVKPVSQNELDAWRARQAVSS